MSKTTSPLGEIIKRRLQALTMTQKALAERMDVSENAVSKWIRTGQISRDKIPRLAEVLQVSIDELFRDAVITDEAHVARADDEQRRLLNHLFDRLSSEQKEHVLRLMAAKVQHNEALVRELGPKYQMSVQDRPITLRRKVEERPISQEKGQRNRHEDAS